MLEFALHDQKGGFQPPFFYVPFLYASLFWGAFSEGIFVRRIRWVRQAPNKGKRTRIRVALQQLVETTVTGLGYELVEIERSQGGLLRITIDWPWQARDEQADQVDQAEGERLITVEDCEIVTRQLQFALEVEGADYARLEVSSPGIDRLLRNDTDLTRFLGYEVDVTLNEPIGVAVADGKVSPLRKKFRGTLERAESGEGWQIVWQDKIDAKPGQRISAKRLAAVPVHALGFTLDETREVRLAPVVDFSGRPKVGKAGAEAQDTTGGEA